MEKFRHLEKLQLHGRQRSSDIGGPPVSSFLSPPSSLSPFPSPLIQLEGLGERCKLPSWSTKCILVHLEAKIKSFRGQISYIFNRQNLKVLLKLLATMAPTTQSIMMTKIVHHIRDCVGIIGMEGSNTLIDPCRLHVKYWGRGAVRTLDPCGVDAYVKLSN